MGNTESTEGNKQRISFIIICANTLVNNERGAPYRKRRKGGTVQKMRKEYARRKSRLVIVFAL
jgi:hypothetical protein